MPLKHGLPSLETFIGFITWRARVGTDADGPERYYSGVKVWVQLGVRSMAVACIALRVVAAGMLNLIDSAPFIAAIQKPPGAFPRSAADVQRSAGKHV